MSLIQYLIAKCIVFVLKTMYFLNAIQNRKALLIFTYGTYGTLGAYEIHRTSGAHGTLGTN
jgi:hypothetical protein